MISNDQTTTMNSEKASELKLEDQTEQGDSPDEHSFDPAWNAKLQRRAVRKVSLSSCDTGSLACLIDVSLDGHSHHATGRPPVLILLFGQVQPRKRKDIGYD